MNINRVI